MNYRFLLQSEFAKTSYERLSRIYEEEKVTISSKKFEILYVKFTEAEVIAC